MLASTGYRLARLSRVAARKDSAFSPRRGKLQPLLVPSSSIMSRRSASTSTNSNKTTCLIDFHRKRCMNIQPFAGYMMPIVYKNQTITSEHIQTRTSASAFDVSHMMQTTVRGNDRVKFLERLTVADIDSMGLDKCTLSVFTNESGGIIDDCIIAKRQDHLHIVSNAGNADTIWSWLNLNLNQSPELSVQLDRLVDKGLIALQGPAAAQVLQQLVEIDLSGIEFMNTRDIEVKGIGDCQITRCGYTGEDGFEISIVPDQAEKLVETLCKDDRVKPAGLGARDTLRLEAGLCLHGHDITSKTTPVEAALSWTIQKRRRIDGEFPGSKVILNQLKEGSKLKRIGLMAVSGGPPAREGSMVTDLNGNELGVVTSGTFAPKLEKNIAMAYLPSSLANEFGYSLGCIVRGKKFVYNITKMPFVKSNYYFKGK